jgi:hypothetical protein
MDNLFLPHGDKVIRQDTHFIYQQEPVNLGLKSIAAARKWSISSSVIFFIGSIASSVSSASTAKADYNLFNLGQMAGYFTYTSAYMIYLCAEYRNSRYLYLVSTLIFMLGSLLFVIFSGIDSYGRQDYSLSNICSNISNMAWLIGYALYFRSEKLSINQRGGGLDMLSVPILHSSVNP